MYIYHHQSEHWPIWSSDPMILGRLLKREEIIQKCNYRRGLLIDFDYSKFTDEESVVSEGEQTVCRLCLLTRLKFAHLSFRVQFPSWPSRSCMHLHQKLLSISPTNPSTISSPLSTSSFGSVSSIPTQTVQNTDLATLMKCA